MRKLLTITVAISMALFLITPQSFAESCECDLNGDGTCDGLDWLLFYPDWGRTDCPAIPPAPIPITGQTNCYDEDGFNVDCAGTGQDGEYQVGVPWPTPRFEDNGDGTVTDYLTGLIWLKNANCFGAIYWNEALDSSNNLADGQCGLSDGSIPGAWHLPNVRELHSLIDYGNFWPALPTGHPFTDVLSFYWTSTNHVDEHSTNHAWEVHMIDGRLSTSQKYGSCQRFVWPVRGGN